jgi:hypothetical protein
MELHERLKIFFTRLQAAPPVRDAEEALALICRLIDEVEDEFCNIPRSTPPPKQPSGRMYPPQSDSIYRSEKGIIRIRTAGHIIICTPDGAIRIENIRQRRVEIIKPSVQD